MTGYSQALEFRDHYDGSVTAVLVVTLPAGRALRFSDTLAPDELIEMSQALARLELPTQIAGAAKWATPGDFFWEEAAPRLKKNPSDKRAREAWWKGLGKEARQRTRATFHAIMAASPATDETVQAKLAWWGRLSKNSRVRLRDKHGNYGGDLFRDAMRSVKSVARTVAPIASSVVKAVPVYGDMIAHGIDAAATAIDDPKRLALLALAGPGAIQALNMIQRPGSAAEAGRVLGGLAADRKNIAATSVMEKASRGLALAAPKLGAHGALARGASAALQTSSRLASAEIAHKAGAPRAAAKIALRTFGEVSRAASSPAAARSLITAAKKTARNVASVAARKPSPATKKADVVAIARAGRIRSTKGGKVSPAELQAAARAGRLFFIER